MSDTKSRPRHPARSKNEILTWYRDFFDEHDRIPTAIETRELQGPSWQSRRKLGGIRTIATALGIDRTHIPETAKHAQSPLIDSLGAWITCEGIKEAPSTLSAIAAFQAGGLIATAKTYKNNFGSWDNALEETGLFKFTWTASECIGNAYRARQAYPGRKTSDAIAAFKRRGATPTVKDTFAHYPDLRSVTIHRLSWDSWQQQDVPRDIKRRNTLSILSQGILALGVVDGELADFEEGNNILHGEDRGPAFSRDLYAHLAPDHMSVPTGYIWSLDFMERAYDLVSGRSERDNVLPVEDLGIGPVKRTATGLLNKTFIPEFKEL